MISRVVIILYISYLYIVNPFMTIFQLDYPLIAGVELRNVVAMHVVVLDLHM